MKAMSIKLLAILVLLCVLKVRSGSIWVDGEGWVDYEFGDVHQISSSSSPMNVSLAQSAVTIEFFASEFDNFYFDLGDLRNFGLVGSQDIYNTGNSTVYGNYGIYSSSNSTSNSTDNSNSTSTLSSVPDGLVIDGTVENTDSQASENALNTARYLLNEASSFQCNNTFNESTSNLLGGQTLGAGISCWSFNDLYIVGGNLKLDAGGDDNAYFVIRVMGSLTVGSWGRSQTVNLINGGSSCNVYWLVQGNVLLHTGSSLIGSVIAGGDVQLDVGASVTGAVVSANGDINLYSANIDNSLCSNNTRENFNVSFAIWPAIAIPLDLGDHDQLLVLNDESNGFEIVANGGGFSYINFNIPPLSSNSTQSQLLNNSDYSVQWWFMAPYGCGIQLQKFDSVSRTDDDGFFFTSDLGQGTYFFVMVYNEQSSSSSTGGGGTGGQQESSSSSTGVIESSSTGHVESSSTGHVQSSSTGTVESSTGLPHSSSGLPSLSSSGTHHQSSTGAH